VVPSPEPKEILELDLIKRVLDMGIICIALGGGGVPVIKNGNGKITGSEAVIDKDRSSALLAKGIDADIFIISTDTDKVYLNYKKPDQKALDNVGIDELEAYYKEGQFPPGSMGPKIESVIRFIREGGKKALITSYEYLMDAIEGKQGTHIHA
jgi:carbamate kinase